MRIVAVVTCLLAACAARANLGVRPRGAAGQQGAADWAETRVTGAGDVALYVQRWRPRDREPVATVVIHHGLADHSSRYAAFAEKLVAAGYAVWSFDMRGHGRSSGRRVTFDRIDDLLGDLDAVLREVAAREPGRPVFVYGHSLGGLVSSLYAIERQPPLAGVVLAAPGIAFDAPPFQLGAVRVAAALLPNAPAHAISHRDFSRRPEVVAEMDADPLIDQGKLPARSARAASAGVARVWARVEQLRVPLLVVHGTGDKITAAAGSRELVDRAGSRDKTLRLYDGLVHDLLREPDGAGARVAQDVIAWLDAHRGATSVTAPASTPVPRHLRGDGRGRAMSIALDLRGELPADDGAGDIGVTAGARVRFGFGRVTAAGLGYYGGIDVRGGAQDGAVYEADAHLAGLALRGRRGLVLGVTGGVGIGGVRGATATHAPVELDLQLPAGPVRLVARAGLGWRLGGDDYADDAFGLADEATALVGVRLGRDRPYWADVTAGAGPYLAFTYRNLGGVELYGVALGLDLWGGN